MNLFGIGPAEMAVIAIIALIVFGPGKLPEVMGQVGKAIRDFRRMTADLTGEFEKTIGTDLNEMRNQISGGLSGLTSEVSNVTESVKRDLAGASTSSGSTYTSSSSVDTTSTSTTYTSPSSSASAVVSADSANGSQPTPPPKPVASKRDPLADVSFLEDIGGQNGHDRAASSAEADGHASEPLRIAASSGSGSTSGATSEALARARQRRQSAGYGRRSTSSNRMN